MTFDRARAVADAVLFEGCLLRTYRAPALRDQMRWQFGVLAPPVADVSQIWRARTECLVEPDSDPALDVRVRFLHLHSSVEAQCDDGSVREVEVTARFDETCEVNFEAPGAERTHDGVTYRARALSGIIRVSAEPLDGLRRVRVTVENHTSWDKITSNGRDAMLARSLVSTHALLAVRGGEFVSLLDPPGWARPAAESCRNLHTWPVLIGDEGQRDVMLSSPIILYDYPPVSARSLVGIG